MGSALDLVAGWGDGPASLPVRQAPGSGQGLQLNESQIAPVLTHFGSVRKVSFLSLFCIQGNRCTKSSGYQQVLAELGIDSMPDSSVHSWPLGLVVLKR